MIRRAPSDLHAILQKFLKNKFFDSEIELEKPFSKIGRVADLVFEKEKLVVEIQTSLIRVTEMLQRQEDYKKVGYSVLWLVHRDLFLKENRPLVTRFFYKKRAYAFSFGPQNQFHFYNLNLQQIQVEKILCRPPLFERILRFIFGF
ncbi:MAG: hypothetical protein EB053_01730 [Chlamydiae bacterium]|nr:hypothetical protein [Chlamydiota bacterium]